MKTLKLQRIAIACLFVLLSFYASAITHVVQKGETIESIAQNYNITVEQLKAANPAVSNLFFIGLKLTIPEIQNTQQTLTMPGVTQTANEHQTEDVYIPSPETNATPALFSARNFSSFYALYTASVKAFEYGQYGLGAVYYNESGGGFMGQVSTNLGIVELNSTTIEFGPVYGLPVHNNLLVYAQLKGFIVVSEVYGSNSAEVGGGMYCTPGFSLNLGAVNLSLGYNLGWIKPAQINKGMFSHNLVITAGLQI